MKGDIISRRDMLDTYSRWLVKRAWAGVAVHPDIQRICKVEKLPAPEQWGLGILGSMFEKYSADPNACAQLSDIFTLREIEDLLRKPSPLEDVCRGTHAEKEATRRP